MSTEQDRATGDSGATAAGTTGAGDSSRAPGEQAHIEPGAPAARGTADPAFNASPATAGAGTPAGPAVNEGAFARDAGVTGFNAYVVDYINRVRGGEVGALPALLGLIVMVVIFSTASSVFLTKGNLANLTGQAGSTAFIAMGLVFVLLLGEIDLALGTASGVCAAAMGLALNQHGDLRAALGNGTWWVVVAVMLAALALAVFNKLWPAAVIVALGVIVLLAQIGGNQYLGIYLAIAMGVAIGLLTGALVSKVGIPSFIVTLALFLAWQGVLLKFIGNGNAIATRNFSAVNAIVGKNLPVIGGWIFFILIAGGYIAYTFVRSTRRRAQNLAAEPITVVLVRGAGLLILGAAATWFLNQQRSPNPKTTSIEGIPYVVPIVLVVMVFWTLMLTKTTFGRYLYAVGGNAEAARRAGIDLDRIRVGAFAIAAGLAAIGGVVQASFIGGVPSDAGGGNTLLYAVGAAVIGGTSLFGGRGRVRDAVLGAIVISMIPNGLGLLPNLSSAYSFIITGLVLLIAASIDAISRRRAASR